MTKLEKAVLERIMECCQHPSAPGSAYDENMRQIKVDQLVPGVANDKLLDSKEYKAGYRRAWAEINERVRWLLLTDTPNKEDQKKYSRSG